MKKILTVVVPTYNVEKYIDQCLSSFVIPEIMEDLEVLAVNDGSKDGSVRIAQRYEEQYPDTFRIIHKENGGHGSTINRGIQEASGDYFKVVDGDDWVDRQAFVKLMETLRTSHSDVVLSNYYWVKDADGTKRPEFKEPFAGVVYGREYRFEDISADTFMKMHAVTIRTSVLKEKIPAIDEHCFYVDMEYVLFPIPYVNTVTCIDEFVYMYRIGLPGQSMNMKSMQKNAANYDRVLGRLLDYYQEQQRQGIATYRLVYLENSIGRMVASRFKIFLSFPYSPAVAKEMRHFDRNLHAKFPNVYQAVRNRAVWLLRKTDYKTYYLAHKAFRIKERLRQ